MENTTSEGTRREKTSPAVLTVVIPAYNCARHIERTIRSIQRQTIRNWEMIISDDASTDGTADIVASMAARDPRIKLIRQKVNSGKPLRNRHKATLAATTEWVVSIDADDFVDSDYLEKLLQRRRETGADIILSIMRKQLCENDTNFSRRIPAADFNSSRVMTGPEAAMHTVGVWRISFCGVLTRRADCIAAVSLMTDVDHLFHDDETFSRILLDRANRVAIADTEYFYVANACSVTHERNCRRHLVILNDLVLEEYFAKRYGAESPQANAARRAFFYHFVDMLRLHRNYPEYSREEYLKTERLIRYCRKNIRFRKVRGKVNGRYYALMRLPLAVARPTLALIDAVHPQPMPSATCTEVAAEPASETLISVHCAVGMEA